MMDNINTAEFNDNQLLQVLELNIALSTAETVVLKKHDLARLVAMAKHATAHGNKNHRRKFDENCSL
jgi:hypothetical protein